jgi:hypothetical protein
MTTDARKLEGLLRNDFRAFIHKVFTTLSPGQDYERSWHIEAIAYQLERVRRGEITRLIINMPAVAQIDIRVGRFPRVHSRTRPIAPHHLRQLFRRTRQKALQRLPRRARGALVSVSLPQRADRALQARPFPGAAIDRRRRYLPLLPASFLGAGIRGLRPEPRRLDQEAHRQTHRHRRQRRAVR